MNQANGLRGWISRWLGLNRWTAKRPLSRKKLALEALEGREVPATFSGANSVAVGDINQDGFSDVIRAAQSYGRPVITVTSGKDGSILKTFDALERTSRNGVNLAVGDFNGDGFKDIAVAEARGGDQMRVYSGKNYALLSSFSAFGGWNGGVSLAAGDTNNNGVPELIMGKLAEAAPQVRVVAGQARVSVRTLTPANPNIRVMSATTSNAGSTVTFSQLASINPFGPAYRGGVSVGAGDLNGDGHADIIAGTATSGGRVQEISGKDTKTVLNDFNTFGTGGVQVAAGNFSSINHADLVVAGRGTFSGGDVRVYRGTTSTIDRNFQSAAGNSAGTNIAVGSFSGNLTNQVVTATKGEGAGVVRIHNSTTNAADTILSPIGSGPSTKIASLYKNTNQASDPTVSNRLVDVSVSKGAATQTLDLTNNFRDPNAANARVTFQTNQGAIGIELLNQQTPLTVKNFLSYVDSDRYDGTIIHRSPANFVVQGGGYKANGSAPNTTLDHIPEFAAVPNEFDSKRSNVRGTVAMAKLGGDPNSAKSEFFFNVADNSSNLDNQNGGFTVFANVVSGLDVVDKINNLTRANLSQTFSDIPVINNFTGTSVGDLKADTNLVTISDVVVGSRGEMLTFSIVNNSNPNVVTPTIVGNKLSLAYSATNTGSSVIQVRATDLTGRAVDTAFTVRVT